MKLNTNKNPFFSLNFWKLCFFSTSSSMHIGLFPKKKTGRRDKKTSRNQQIEHLNLSFNFFFALRFIKKKNSPLKNTSRLCCSLIFFSSCSRALFQDFANTFFLLLLQCMSMSQRFVVNDGIVESHTEAKKKKTNWTCTIWASVEEWLLLYCASS